MLDLDEYLAMSSSTAAGAREICVEVFGVQKDCISVVIVSVRARRPTLGEQESLEMAYEQSDQGQSPCEEEPEPALSPVDPTPVDPVPVPGFRMLAEVCRPPSTNSEQRHQTRQSQMAKAIQWNELSTVETVRIDEVRPGEGGGAE